jgi:hypothetical protein
MLNPDKNIYLFIGTCTSVALQFFTNASQRPIQMSMIITIAIDFYMRFTITLQMTSSVEINYRSQI